MCVYRIWWSGEDGNADGAGMEEKTDKTSPKQERGLEWMDDAGVA